MAWRFRAGRFTLLQLLLVVALVAIVLGFLVALGQHDAYVSALAFSPDGRRVAIVVNDLLRSRVKVWDAESRTLRVTVKATGGEVRALAWSPDCTKLATGGDRGVLEIWDARTGEKTAAYVAHRDWMFALAFAPDGESIASGSSNGNVKLWDSEAGQLLSTLSGHQYGVHCFVFAPDGKTIAVGDAGRKTRVWDVTTRKLRQPPLDGAPVAFRDDGPALIVATSRGHHAETVQLYEANTGRKMSELWHSTGVTCSSLSPDGTWFVTGTRDGTVTAWNADKGTIHFQAEPHTVNVLSLVTSANTIAAGYADGWVRVWDLNRGKLIDEFDASDVWLLHWSYFVAAGAVWLLVWMRVRHRGRRSA